MILFGCVIWVWANVGFAGDMLCILESPNNCRRPMSLERSYVVYIFSLHFTDDTGVYAFFYFADDMGVCVFWVCPTTPTTFAGIIL